MAELGLNPGEPRTYSDLTDEAMTGTQPSENDALQRAESAQAIISDRSENVSDNAIRNVVLQLKLGASEAKPSAISLAAGK